MRCKIGFWRIGLGVQLDQEARDALLQQGRMLTASLLRDRRVLLKGAMKGACTKVITGDPQCHRKGLGFAARSEVNPPHFEVYAPGVELPRFELTELPLAYDYALDGLVTEALPADHLLPWPKTACLHAQMTFDELMHQSYLRCRSGVRAGLDGSFDQVGVPAEHVRKMGGGYAAVLRRVRHEELGERPAEEAA